MKGGLRGLMKCDGQLALAARRGLIGCVLYPANFTTSGLRVMQTKLLGHSPKHHPATGLTNSVVSAEFVFDRLRLIESMRSALP
jgi:hypothetical protein